MNKFAVYIHIPFCEQKCIYCDFASFVCRENVKEDYFKALISEIKNSSFSGEVTSIYVGGGTPSAVDSGHIEDVFNALKEKFKIPSDIEVTIECNPNSTSFEKLVRYKKMGINRISFGVQSLDDKTLKTIGRIHDKKQAIEALKLAKKAGFENISADLLIGLPSQTSKDLKDHASKLLKQGIKHLSAYMLQIEEGTPLFRMVNDGKIVLPSEDECVGAYEDLVEFLKSHGFERYEISNFALKGFESRHNEAYWLGQNYLGFGLGAHSFVRGVRFSNARDFQNYFQRTGGEKHKLTTKERLEELVMLGLRCKFGFSLAKAKELGFEEDSSKFKSFLDKGILELKEGRVFLNEKFYGVSNTVICDLI